MSSDTVREILIRHVPEASVAYCVGLWETHPFELHVRKKRVTKIGDFCSQGGKTPRITVNNDLSPFLFLTTYIHEVAHLAVHLQHGRRTEAHGAEWKRAFRELLAPMLTDAHFPPDLLAALRLHMADPMATMYSDSFLMRVFRTHDQLAGPTTLLSEIPKGSIFELRGRWFKKEETKRTRVLCQEVKTRRKYLVPADAAVNNVQLSLL